MIEIMSIFEFDETKDVLVLCEKILKPLNYSNAIYLDKTDSLKLFDEMDISELPYQHFLFIDIGCDIHTLNNRILKKLSRMLRIDGNLIIKDNINFKEDEMIRYGFKFDRKEYDFVVFTKQQPYYSVYNYQRCTSSLNVYGKLDPIVKLLNEYIEGMDISEKTGVVLFQEMKGEMEKGGEYSKEVYYNSSLNLLRSFATKNTPRGAWLVHTPSIKNYIKNYIIKTKS